MIFRFKPERWLNLPEAYHPSLSLQTFIAGPHACIGKTMAIIEMKAIIALVLVQICEGFALTSAQCLDLVLLRRAGLP